MKKPAGYGSILLSSLFSPYNFKGEKKKKGKERLFNYYQPAVDNPMTITALKCSPYSMVNKRSLRKSIKYHGIIDMTYRKSKDAKSTLTALITI